VVGAGDAAHLFFAPFLTLMSTELVLELELELIFQYKPI
jgi:hypothetical protein